MKTNLVRPLMLTAAVLMLGAAANAQSTLVAKIPFSFNMNGKTLPAGDYTLARGTRDSLSVIKMSSTGQHTAALALALIAVDQDGGSPRLVFHCTQTAGCALAEAWTGNNFGWKLPGKHVKASGREEIAVIPLHRSQVD